MSFPLVPPKPVQFGTGHGGWVQMSPQLFRTNWNRTETEDITPYLVSMSVSHDTARTAANWVLDATITYDGWLKLRPFVDWLIPKVTVTYADGSEQPGVLGHYIVLDSPEHREETGGTVRLDARDALWVLNMQGIKDVYLAPTGDNLLGSEVDFGPEIQRIIDEALVPGAPDGAKLMSAIPTIPSFVGLDGPIYDEGTRRLEVINGMLEWGADHFPLEVNANGMIGVHQHYRLRAGTSIRTWRANWRTEDFGSPIAEAIESQPFTADLVDKVIVVGGLFNPDPIKGEASIGATFPSANPVASVVANSIKRVYSPYATSQVTANNIAASILEQLLTENTSLTLMVEPDPGFVAIHDVVLLFIADTVKSVEFPFGRTIANGKYVVQRVRYGCMPEDPLMRVDVSTLEGFIPVGVPTIPELP